ncbi:hypothetical protein RB597_002059 [Gaeumannomyces tritici]
MANYDQYQTPLGMRYASKEMLQLFSPRSRANTWRQLWIHLAEAEHELGLPQVTAEKIAELKANAYVSDEAFEVIRVEEKIRRHDVMANVHAYGKEAPNAAGIIHLGATSCYVTDNAELIFIKKGLELLLPKLAKVVSNLQKFALKYKDVPTLGFTHLQPAQLITVGKRACQWIQELVMDLEDIEHVLANLRLRGIQGTTGTKASFMELFEGDEVKVNKLNDILCGKLGFGGVYDISTQTYTRKVDLRIANALSAFGATAERISLDIRHLANWKEIEEPFEAGQIGSSAMAYKRNPMRSERITSLGRKLSTLNANFTKTFEVQMMERTLDDSAIRRIDIPEMFLLADAILISLDNVTDGLVVYPATIRSRVMQELPFMATENIIMKLVAKGASRQEAHEEIRVLSHQASHAVKMEGKANDLIERIRGTAYFAPVHAELDAMLDPALFTGCSQSIVERYCGHDGAVEKALAPYKQHIASAATAELSV